MRIRKAKVAQETFADRQAKIAEAELAMQQALKELKDAEEEDQRVMDDTKEKIDLLCEEAGLFCGLIIDKQNLLNIIDLMVGGDPVVKVPFRLFYIDKEEQKTEES